MTFCKYCGSPLEDGQICSCPNAQAEARRAGHQPPPPPPYPGQPPVRPPQPQNVQPPVQPQRPVQPQQPPVQPRQPKPQGKVAASLKRIGPFFKAYWKRPTDGLRMAVEEDLWPLAIGFNLVRFLVVGVLAFAMFGRVSFHSIQGMARTAMNFFLGLFMGGLGSVVCTALFLGATFGIAKLCKSKISFKGAYIVTSVNSSLTTILLFLTTVCAFVAPAGTVFFLLLSLFSWIVMGVLTAQFMAPENDSGVFWLLYFAAVTVVFFVGLICFLLFMLPLLGSALGSLLSGLGNIGRYF